MYIPEWFTGWLLRCPNTPPPPHFWMTESHFRSHFSTFQINKQPLYFLILFTKWLTAAISDDRKSLLIAFLAISDQYATLIFIFVHKMAAGSHFGWQKITFDRIYRHFRLIRNFDFFFSQNGSRRQIMDDQQEACRPDSSAIWDLVILCPKSYVICWPKVKVGQLQVKSQI